MTESTKAIYFGLAAVLCWSTVATAFKIALSFQSVSQLILIACFTSVICLSVFLAAQGRLKTTLLSLSKDWKKALLFGALNPALYYFVLLWAYQLLPAQVAQPINYTWAIVLSVLAVPFLGQTLKGRDIIALLICYSGVLVISSGASSGSQAATIKGVALAVLSTIIWAGYWILNSRDQRAPTPALLQNFICALPLCAILVYVQADPNPWSAQGVLAGVYIGLFEMGLAFIFWLQAMKRTDNTSRISNLIFLSPFLSLILIYFVLNEAIHPLTLVGLLLIIAGLLIQNKKESEI